MDPHSEMEAREVFCSLGYYVVGWYHSHPTFLPDPSIRDIETQLAYQVLIINKKNLFKNTKGVCPFVGVIVNPYPSSELIGLSRVNMLSVSIDHLGNDIPYMCKFKVIDSLISATNYQFISLLDKYANYSEKVIFSELLVKDVDDNANDKTYLEQLKMCMEKYGIETDLWETLQAIIKEKYCNQV